MGIFSSSVPAPEPEPPRGRTSWPVAGQRDKAGPRLFGADPSKEHVSIDWPHRHRPEFSLNQRVTDETPVPAGKCDDCGGFGSIGFAAFARAGRTPCKRCKGTGDEPR